METLIECKSNRRKMKKIVLGLIVALAGLGLLGFNLGYIPMDYKPILFSWQMLLIVIGIVNICSRESRHLGLILMAVGSFFIAPKTVLTPI